MVHASAKTLWPALCTRMSRLGAGSRANNLSVSPGLTTLSAVPCMIMPGLAGGGVPDAGARPM